MASAVEPVSAQPRGSMRNGGTANVSGTAAALVQAALGGWAGPTRWSSSLGAGIGTAEADEGHPHARPVVRRGLKHTQITLAPGAFTISGLSYHADDPNCCPRYMIRQTATWKNGKLVLGPCQRRLA